MNLLAWLSRNTLWLLPFELVVSSLLASSDEDKWILYRSSHRYILSGRNIAPWYCVHTSWKCSSFVVTKSTLVWVLSEASKRYYQRFLYLPFVACILIWKDHSTPYWLLFIWYLMFSAGLNKSRLKHQDWVYNGNDKHNVPELQFKQHQLVPQWLTAWYLYLRGSNKLRENCNE
jgi:hypothetical protein